MAKQTPAKSSARADLSSPQSAEGNARPVPKRKATVTPASAKPTGKPATKSAPAKSKKAGPVGTTTAAAKKATSNKASSNKASPAKSAGPKSTPKPARSTKAATGDSSSQTAKQGGAKPAKSTASPPKKAIPNKASSPAKAVQNKSARRTASAKAETPGTTSKPAGKPAGKSPAGGKSTPADKPKPTPKPADNATRIRLSVPQSPAGDEVELKPVAEGLTGPAGASAAGMATPGPALDDGPAPSPVLHRPDRLTSDSAPRKNRAGLGARDLDHFRRLLLEKRAELTGDMTSMEREALQHADAHPASATADTADLGSDAYEQEFTLGLVEKERQVLREINEALAKLHDGTYGLCEATGEPIGRPRLEAKPWAKFSIQHARKVEKPTYRR